jgi:hypothetical protein
MSRLTASAEAGADELDDRLEILRDRIPRSECGNELADARVQR